MTNLDIILKNRDYFADKGPFSQSYDFSSSQVWMWELDQNEGWVLKNWCFQFLFWGAIAVKLYELCIFWKLSPCWERLKAGGEGDDRGWDGWMASLTWWHEFEQVLGVGDGQGSQVWCSPWGRKESGMTEWLNWIELRKLVGYENWG